MPGDLRVVVPNRQWGGVRGQMKRGWRVNAAVTQVTQEQPFFTQVFAQPELAVMAALALSASAAGEYAFGFVLKHTQSESYIATYYPSSRPGHCSLPPGSSPSKPPAN